MHPFLIAMVLQGLPSVQLSGPNGVPTPLNSSGLAKEWAKAEMARHATLTKVVEVNGLDETQAQLALSLRLKAQFQKEWHFNDSSAHRELRAFMDHPQRDAGQLVGR